MVTLKKNSIFKFQMNVEGFSGVTICSVREVIGHCWQ